MHTAMSMSMHIKRAMASIQGNGSNKVAVVLSLLRMRMLMVAGVIKRLVIKMTRDDDQYDNSEE